MKILITGATSYIIERLMEELKKEKENELYAVVRRKHAGRFHDSCNVKYIYCDMDEYDTLYLKVGASIDCVVHCAWMGTRGRDNHDEIIQCYNVQGTIKLVQSILKLKCKKLIQIGSLAEYGMTEKNMEPVTEQTACAPITPYAKAKLQVFFLLKQVCKENRIQFCEARLGSVYGKHMQQNSLVQYVLCNLRENRDVRLQSTCEQRWEFIYVDDVVNILHHMIKNEFQENILNISSGETEYLKDFVNQIKEIFAGDGKIILGCETQNAQHGCEAIWCDVSSLRKFMDAGYEFVSFKKGILQMLEPD